MYDSTVYNALAEGETIVVGESKTFYLAPYSAPKEVYLEIINGNSSDNFYGKFTYTYLVDGKNEDIIVTFSPKIDDGINVVMSGSDVLYEENPPV